MLSPFPADYEKVSADKAEELLPESQMEDLLRYTRVFARMKPEQKVDVVKLHMKHGVTAMCGDGANDAAALQKAHAGMALSASTCSSGEVAAIVAHFATTSDSLFRFTDLIRIGRGALATIMHAYKYLISYGQQQALAQTVHLYMGASRGEVFWLHMDVVLNISLCACIMESLPSKKLRPYRPTSRLLGSDTLWSLLGHIVCNWIFFISIIVVLYQQDWFRCKEFDASNINLGAWWLKGDNYETSVTALFVMFNCINASVVFNFGFDYRRPFIRNWIVPVGWAVWFIYFSLVLFLDPNGLGCLYRMNCGDESLMQWWRDNGRIPGYSGPYSTSPGGCSCNDQIVDDDWCEAEYIQCDVSHYNQFYHHNIIPEDWRGKFYGMFVANLVALFLLEGLVLVGPVRKWIRKRKAARGWSRPILGVCGTEQLTMELEDTKGRIEEIECTEEMESSTESEVAARSDGGEDAGGGGDERSDESRSNAGGGPRGEGYVP
eukprot:Polyplicarium_translucidae@DN2642_c0_g1_i1.p1